MENESAITRTIEDFVYQNENRYFNGKLVRENDIPESVRGAAYEFVEGDRKRYIGQLSIVFKTTRSNVIFIMDNLDDTAILSDLAQKMIAVIK